MFQDQEFSGASVVAGGVVELVSVEGGDEVGVGFDCTGFAQVAASALSPLEHRAEGGRGG